MSMGITLYKIPNNTESKIDVVKSIFENNFIEFEELACFDNHRWIHNWFRQHVIQNRILDSASMFALVNKDDLLDFMDFCNLIIIDGYSKHIEDVYDFIRVRCGNTPSEIEENIRQEIQIVLERIEYIFKYYGDEEIYLYSMDN